MKRCVDWASPVPPFMTFIIFCRIFTTHDIVSMLEDENVAANIFIEPNDGGVTDEDSGDEDGVGFLNNLSGNQLNAPAELVISGQRFGSLEEAARSLENPNCSDSQPNNTNSTAHPQAARSLENPNYIYFYLQRYGSPPQLPGPSCQKRRRVTDNARYDGYKHYLVEIPKRRRCAGEFCSKRPFMQCSNCDVGLCVGCNLDYHTK